MFVTRPQFEQWIPKALGEEDRYLLLYCYAVEEFGQHLLRLALAGKLQDRWRLLRGAARLNCHEFGFAPSLRHEGRDHSVHVVPNVFGWTERVVEKDGELRKVALTPSR